MRLNTIGEVLKFYRKKYRFKQSHVCRGICSMSTLSRIEKGNREVDSLTLEALLGRVGKEVLQFEMILNDYDYYLWTLRRQIRKGLKLGKREEVIRLLEEYRENMPEDDDMHIQFLICCNLQACDSMGKDEKIREALKALQCTCPEFSETSLYNETEIELILFLAHERYTGWEDMEKRLHNIRKLVYKIYSGRRRERICTRILMELIDLNWDRKQYLKVIDYAEEAIEFISQSRSMEYIAELHFIKAKAIAEYYSGQKWNTEVVLCRNECLMAYYTFDIMNNDEGKSRVEEFCEEKLKWQITK